MTPYPVEFMTSKEMENARKVLVLRLVTLNLAIERELMRMEKLGWNLDEINELVEKETKIAVSKMKFGGLSK